MNAISKASAPDAPARGQNAARPRRAARARQRGLTRDLLAAAARSALHSVKTIYRATFAYRWLLSGPLPDRVLLSPEDFRDRRLDDADQMFRGRYRLSGGALHAKDVNIWDADPPNGNFAEDLHGFSWIRHFAAAGSDAAATHVRAAVNDWLERYAHRVSGLPWRPHVVARRLIAWCAHSRLVLSGADVLWRSAVFHSIGRQARYLSRVVYEAREGEPKLTAAIGLALTGVSLPDGERRLSRGLEATLLELRRQILPDGGHISRDPETLLRVYFDLSSLADALKRGEKPVPDAIRTSMDRMAPMLRFFRHGDGRLALFNGGAEGAEKSIDAVLARDDTQGKPFGFASQSRFHRLSKGATAILLDAGNPPLGPFSTSAHAGALSFEMSSGAHRIVVNCGASLLRGAGWREALRATAAHSSLTIGDASSAAILNGLPGRRLGKRMAMRGLVASRRNDGDDGIWVDASHESYVRAFGLRHERRLYLAESGHDLRGEDRLVPDANVSVRDRRRRPFAVRFHIHPDVRVSRAQDGASVILLLPSGEAWRFRVGAGALNLEESVYLGSGDSVRRAEQIVVTGDVFDEPVKIQWALRRLESGEA